jgi:hypothetical protein
VIWILGYWDLFGIWDLIIGYSFYWEEEIGKTVVDD